MPLIYLNGKQYDQPWIPWLQVEDKMESEESGNSRWLEKWTKTVIPDDKGIKMEWEQKRMKSYINIAEGVGKMKTKRSSELDNYKGISILVEGSFNAGAQNRCHHLFS